MNLIEHWGSGIPRIIGKVKAAGLQEPEFIGGEVDLRINLYRGQMDTSDDNNDINNANNAINSAKQVKNGINNIKSTTGSIRIASNKERKRLEKLLQVIAENPSETQAYYAEQIGVSKRTISRIFASLQKEGILVQNETRRKSDWIIIN